MEAQQYCICLEENVYGNWRAIGVLEDLAEDGDIAQFLVALYSSQKQSKGEQSSIRCVHCHCPLTLYCSVCRSTSQLALPTQPPSSSLSSPPSSLPTHIFHTSSPHSVIAENTSMLDSEKPAGHVKDQQNTAGLSKEEDSDDEDNSFGLDIVKMESTVSSSDHESDFTEPAVSFSVASSSVAESTRSQKNRRRKSDAVVDQGRKKRGSHQDRKKRNSNTSTNRNKTSKNKLADVNKTFTNRLITLSQTEGMKNSKTDIPSEFDNTVSLKEGNSGNKEIFGDVNSEKPRKERKKRKPCASHDLAEGQILPAEERRLAQIHIYDESYFERHRMEDDPLRRPGRRKGKKQSETFTKSSPKPHARMKRKATSSPTWSENSSTDEEIPDHQKNNIQNKPHSLTSSRQNRKNNLQSQTNGDKLIQTLGVNDCDHSVSAGRMEIVDPGNSDRQPMRILVSAQKILPLRTTDGNYARFLYSYFECAHCNKAFTHKRAFNSHVQTHGGQKLNNCTMCEGMVCSCDSVKHENRPTLQCEMCGVHLKSLYALRFHIAAIHKNERPFKCGVCEKSFVLKTKLRSHIKYKHAEGGRLFHCDQCSYRAFDARGLKVHQMCVHSKERPFKCTFCPSAFAIKFYLDVHLRKHTGEKPFRCSECSQTFAQRPSLTRHRRNHHGLEPAASSKTADSSNPL